MPSKTLSLGFAVLLAVFAVTMLMTTTHAAAQTVHVLYSFDPNDMGAYYPAAGLIFDAAGNLYGTTAYGNCNGAKGGTVFELMRKTDGTWTKKTLHNFGNGEDGYNPVASLTFDAAGNLYGTTNLGGAYDYGTVFELSPTADGDWTEKVLHSFNNNNGEDGYYPLANVIFDSAGNLYGTTQMGGAAGGQAGTVFELSPTGSGDWTEKILHSFGFHYVGEFPPDGHQPVAGLIFDASGNLYGTTLYGGLASGTVFELSPATDGSWKEELLRVFRGDENGGNPAGGLIFDAAGNLYGTTAFYGACYSCLGTVFELTRPSISSNPWIETVLHSFGNYINVTDGAKPVSSLIFDAEGNLYGATEIGGNGLDCGNNQGCGTVFKLTPVGGGVWHRTWLHSFGTSGDDGWTPLAGLISDAVGNLYGTTSGGGLYQFDGNGGTVFEITP
jgi:uncharacterized repeat protein (TIGR03803 family)